MKLKTLAPLLQGVGIPSWQTSVSGVSLVMKPVPWSKKPVYLRNLPYTNITPHRGQIEARIRFGEIARAHKGEKGFREGLPIVAYHIKTEMSGFRASSRMSEADYPSKQRRTFRTLDELKRLLGERPERPGRVRLRR